MAVEATFSVTNGQSLYMRNGSTIVDLTDHGSPVRCGNLFSFHASFVSIGKATNSSAPAQHKLMIVITVEEVLSGASNKGWSCKLKVDYNGYNNYYGHSTSGVWNPLPVQLASVAKGSVMSFTVPMPGGTTSNHNFTPTKLTLSVEPSTGSIQHPTLTEFQKARSESILATLNEANLCDASLVPAGANGNGIRVSRAILAHASPYFKTMFNGDWAESAAKKHNKPIDFDWTATAVILCLMHMYSGWVLGDTVPDCAELKDLLDKHKVDTQRLSLHQLLELVDLAEMLELPLLVNATYKIMAKKVGCKVKTSAVVANKLNQKAKVVEGAVVDKASDVEE